MQPVIDQGRLAMASRAGSLRRLLRAWRRRMSSSSDVWERALPGELSFWARYIETGGLDSPQEFQGRLDPEAPILDPYLLRAIDRAQGNPVKIVDVGAGPMTSMGFKDPRAPEREIELLAVDPLADQYAVFLAAAGVTPPVPTQKCRGEDIARTFGPEHFDIAYARNSLDHSADPMAAIESMLRAVKIDGAVVLIHGRREGEARGYEELHQWNFDLDDDRFVLFDRRRRYDVGEHLGQSATLSVETFDTGGYGEWVAATLTRMAL